MGSTKHWLYLLHWLSQSKNCPDGKVIMFSVSNAPKQIQTPLGKNPRNTSQSFCVGSHRLLTQTWNLDTLSCKKLPHKLKLSARTSGCKICIKLPKLMHSCVIGANTYKSENNEILQWDWTAWDVEGAVLGLSFISNRVNRLFTWIIYNLPDNGF